MSRVIYATDGSPSAEVAGRLIAGISWPAGTSICALAVVPLLPDAVATSWPPVAGTTVDEMLASEEAIAREAAHVAASALLAAGRTADARVERGDPASVISGIARDQAADLIVVGSRGRGWLASALLGSVSAALTRGAPCPVLVARTPTIDRVLVADDGSPGASRAVDYVRVHPYLLGAAVRVVGAVAPGTPASETFDLPIDAAADTVLAAEKDDATDELRVRLADTAGGLAAVGPRTDVTLDDRQAVIAILDAADEWPADLVVIGTGGRGGIERLLLGSVSEQVLHHAGCSVLIVRPTPTASPAVGQSSEDEPVGAGSAN